MKSKQTAVEWLIEELNNSPSMIASGYKFIPSTGGYKYSETGISIPKEMIDQALEMEKEQIMDAYNNGDNRSAELYYEETYEK